MKRGSTDAKERRRAAEELHGSERQWREVFEHNPAMCFMVDASGIVLSVNAFGASQLGYAASELAGQSVLNLSSLRKMTRSSYGERCPSA
jgi:PAS domain S-box-containing protein